MSKENITFIVPVCGRNQHRRWNTVHSAPIFKTCILSIVDTVSDADKERFSFSLAMGYDDDDEYFINPKNIAYLQRALEDYPWISFTHHAFSDTKHNPVRCWNHLANIAIANGADYLYQTGDDVQLMTKGWATAFVDALKTTGNVGVAAPQDMGYYGLFTQSFTHKKHVEIMGNYFPPAFKNWYCDNAITDMYKGTFDHYLTDYHIKNTGGAQRYAADDAQPILVGEVIECIIKLAEWLKSNNSDFDMDAFYQVVDNKLMKNHYEKTSQGMTTAPAKPIWGNASNIFKQEWDKTFNKVGT